MKFLPILLYFNIILFSQSKFDPQLQLLLNASNGSSLSKISSEKYSVVIYSDKPEEINGIQINSVLPSYITANLTINQIQELAENKNIQFITTGEVNYIHNDIASMLTGATQTYSFLSNGEYNGSDVLICIIDTGIDWTHPDFRDPFDSTKSRIAAIWDQTITPVNNEQSPAIFNYGVEYSKTDIEDELDGSPSAYIREKDNNGHGTHVAGTAAGNGSSGKYRGLAPDAELLVVKAGNVSFPAANIIDALTWAKNKADLLGKSIVVNLSLGSDGGPHDGSDPKSVAINKFVGEGKVVVVSAGNSGGANIHTSAVIPAGESYTVSLEIPDYTPNKGPGNDNLYLDTWFDDSSCVTASVASPNSFLKSQPAGGQSSFNSNDGGLYTYNNIALQNNDRQIYIAVYDSDESHPPVPGRWQVTFTNNSDKEVKFHSWLYDACIGDKTLSLVQGDNKYNLGNNAAGAIVTGSFVHRNNWTSQNGNDFWCVNSERTNNISAFSSVGPTRNEMQKPDISAPGQAIISCRSKIAKYPEDKIISDYYVVNQGTSMASAVVTGAVALILEQNNNLTSEEVKHIIINSADSDNYTGSSLPDNSWGYGKLNVLRAMQQIVPSHTAVVQNAINDFQLEQNYPNPFNPVTTIKYYLPEGCNINLKLYDVLGKEIKLLDSGYKTSGSYSVELNAQNLSSGIYFYELRTPAFTAVRKLILQK